MRDVRPSPIAGQWYPGEAAALARMVDGFLEPAGAEPPVAPEVVIGLLAPHAGLIYSGPVAGQAFRWARGRAVAVAAVLCPSHFHADAPVLTSAHAAYATPLGEVPVDAAGLAEFQARWAGPPLTALRHDREHAIEIELPFLQRVLAPGFTLLPLMLRDQSPATARAVAEALAGALAGRPALIVASSDLSHYEPQAVAERLDGELLRQVADNDPAAVLAAQASGRGFACGVGALAAGLWAAQTLGATRARVVRYATSGAITGDYAAVVGYGAAVFLK